MEISAQSIIPKVKIVEDEIDFGGVTVGNYKTKKISIINESPIIAMLEVDLLNEDAKKEYEGVECLELLADKELMAEDETSVFQSMIKDSV